MKENLDFAMISPFHAKLVYWYSIGIGCELVSFHVVTKGSCYNQQCVVIFIFVLAISQYNIGWGSGTKWAE